MTRVPPEVSIMSSREYESDKQTNKQTDSFHLNFEDEGLRIGYIARPGSAVSRIFFILTVYRY